MFTFYGANFEEYLLCKHYHLSFTYVTTLWAYMWATNFHHISSDIGDKATALFVT